MGEYAHDYMRREIMEAHGYDIGDYDDDDEPKGNAARHAAKPKRVKCPHCDKHPKERGLADHIRDAHGISKVEQAIAKAEP